MQVCNSTVNDLTNVREAVCISVEKIMDACRDQDCMEDVPVYLTVGSQETLENATSVKARSAELLYADVSVEPLGYRDGYYCVNIQYYYRIIADAVLCAVRPAAIYGLATVSKRVSLFGGQAESRRFTSSGTGTWNGEPEAVVEAIDPTVLKAGILDRCSCRKEETRVCTPGTGLPEPVAAAFDDELVMGGMSRQLVVSLGQFSLVRLERRTQLTIPSYDYCVPEKACCDGDCCCQENPCEAFCSTAFPVDAFFPQGNPGTENRGGRGNAPGWGCGNHTSRCSTCEASNAPVQETVAPGCEELKPPQNRDCGGEKGFQTMGRQKR